MEVEQEGIADASSADVRVWYYNYSTSFLNTLLYYYASRIYVGGQQLKTTVIVLTMLKIAFRFLEKKPVC